MWAFIQQMCEPRIALRKQWRSTRGASSGRCHPLRLEALEPRTLLASLGNLTDANQGGLVVLNDEPAQLIQEPFEITPEIHTFELGKSAFVRAKVTDIHFRDPLFSSNIDIEVFLMIFRIENGERDFLESRIYSDEFDEDLSVRLPSGSYEVKVSGSFLLERYDLSIYADTAPGQIVEGSLNPTIANLQRRDLGPLTVLPTLNRNIINEYVGIGADAPDKPALEDAVDTYVFEVVEDGSVEFSIRAELFGAAADNDIALDLNLYRDFDQDGVFARDTAEQIASASNIRPGDVETITRTLPAGRYGLVVTPAVAPPGPILSGVGNYHLDINYTVPDGAGNTLAAARDVGTVGSFGVTFGDYLSLKDTADVYRFSTAAGGPFVWSGTLTGITPGSNFELEFLGDFDGDGRIESQERVISDRTGNSNEELSFSYTAPGTYFVRVRHTGAGEGIYALQFSNRNNDLAGNTLTTAHGPIDLRGLKEFSDRVTSTDTVDIYKVRLNRQAAFEAQLVGMPAGTDANLSLIRDSDGDGLIDQGETLASSSNTGNAVERVTRNLTAGTYFVRVARVAGAPSYNLRLIKDAVGEQLATAATLSPNGGGELEFLGPEDDTDVYKFTLASTRNVGLSVGSNTEPIAVRLGRDGNGNGVLDQAEVLSNTTAGVGPSNLFRINLNAGTYFVILNPLLQDEGTNYHVTVFNETPDRAGNTLAAARDLGTLNLSRSFTDFVGDGSLDFMDDLDDFYRFTVGNGPFDFQATVDVAPDRDGAFRVAVVELIRDDNRNKQSDFGEVLASTVAAFGAAGPLTGEINTVLDLPGTYYLRVKRDIKQVPYSLSLSAISQDTAGNTLGTAKSLGELANPTSTNEFVGRIDRDDFFRFSVPGTGELVASVSGAGISTDIEVIRDVNNDGVIDPGELLATSAPFLGEDDRLHGVILPGAGDNYYVRVRSTGGDAAYTLNLAFSNQRPFIAPFQIPANAEKQIRAVQFDRGGEGVAYHDTTVGNSGNATDLRVPENIDVDASFTTDAAGPGRRVTNTAPGEFLEYTIVVDATGLYDFDARVSSPDPGATFHLEIDGVALSAPVAVPDTGGQDSMTTIAAASNVLLSAGPHILRLAIDTGTGVNNDFAGSFNFIAVRPASAGTFELTPSSSTVTAGEHTQLALAWTVPVGGWRVLKYVDLRLTDERGRMLWIRFDEAANTLSMFDQKSGTFGVAKKIGSNSVLSSPLGRLSLKTTTLSAAGPDSPTFELTFDLTFHEKARGLFTIEAAASDDQGHADRFAFAGVLDVV